MQKINKIAMKKILLLLSFFLCFMLSRATDDFNVVFNFIEKDFKILDDEYGRKIITCSFPFSYGEPDEPSLPIINKIIAAPDGFELKIPEVTVAKHLLLENIDLAPSPFVVSDCIDISKLDSIDRTFKNKVYPAKLYRLTATSQLSNQQLLHYLVTPFIYNVTEKNLYFVDSIRLAYPKSIAMQKQHRRQNSNVEASFAKLCDNARQLPQKAMQTQSIENEIQYLIITNEFLKPCFEPLAEWKRTKGVPSRIATIEEISQMTGDNLNLKIKNYIYELCQNNGLKYVLLGGDASVVPVQYCYSYVRRYDEEENNMPTDLFYACFQGDFKWDSNGNGIIGEIDDGVDMTPSVFITRAPFRKKFFANCFVNKILEYETKPVINNNILICGTKLFYKFSTTNRSDAELYGDSLYNIAIKPFWNGVYTRFYDTNTDFPEGSDYDLEPNNVNEQLSKGYGFVSMITHGNTKLWHMEPINSYYQTTHIGHLHNNSGHTIITTMACMTNAFDKEYDEEHDEQCLAANFIRYPYDKVVAYLGCSRAGWFSFDTWNGPAEDYEMAFYKNLFTSQGEANFGKIVAMAKLSLIGSCQDNNDFRWTQFGLNPLGDPETPIFTDIPKEIPLSINDAGNSLTINSNVDGCRFCVMGIESENGNYYKIYDNCNSISLSDIPQKCCVCITKHNYIPKLYTICNLCNQTVVGPVDFAANKVKIMDTIFKSGAIEIKAKSVKAYNFSIGKDANLTISNNYEN